MGNRKSKILVIALISTLTLTTGCGISITRNQYYGYPDQSKKSNQNEVGSNYIADTLIIKKNGQN